MQISKQDIRDACGATFYNRGQAYARDGQVLSIESETTPFGIHVTGRCRGSHAPFYEQQIDIILHGGSVQIDGECTCPIGYNCKHVAAVALQWLAADDRTLPAVGEQAVNRLLERLQEASRPRTWQPALGDEVLIYLIDREARDDAGYRVEIQLARLLKSGKGLGRPRRLSLYDLQSNRILGLQQPLDAQISDLLMASLRGYRREMQLAGEIGAIALRKMVETGRAYWRNTDHGALRFGAPRALRMDWKRDPHGLRLELQTQPSGGVIVPLDPPYYLDTFEQRVGLLENAGPLDAAQLDVLTSAPVVPLEDAPRLSERLFSELPQLPLPPPVEIALNEIDGLPCQPVLRLQGIEPGRLPGTDRRVHILEPLFAYGDARFGLPSEPLSVLRGNGKITRVHRDVEQEERILACLLDLGFAPMLIPGKDAAFAPSVNSLSESLARWRRFVDQQVPQLRQEGWLVEFDDSFRLAFADGDDFDLEIAPAENGWFELSFGIDLDGRRVELLPLLQPLLQSIDSPAALDELEDGLFIDLGDSRWMELPPQRLRPVVETLFELFDRDPGDVDGPLRLSRLDAVRLAELDESLAPVWRGGESLRELGQRLRSLEKLPELAPPAGLNAELRHYQLQGYSWMQFLRETGFGGILADDMGLGKTMQTLAYLLHEKEQGRLQSPALVVAPTSLMANWRNEAQRFAPQLSVLVLQGPDRKAGFAHIGAHDLVLTTYPLLPRDREVLLQHDYHCVILDEAQTVKNPKSQAAQVAGGLKAEHRICLSGTPMENHLGELWSLFNFLAPGFLGDQQQFNRQYRTPIEKHADGERRLALQRRIAPFLLRRTKEQVATELPEKIEIQRNVAFDSAQADLYESVRVAMDAKVREALQSKGLARSHIAILDALLKLRQICCDPRLLKLQQARKVKHSAKLELLMEMLPELLEEGRRILLFSQFTSMLKLIEERVQALGIGFTKLTGQTRDREAAIERFRSGEVPLFLISLKAGGVGLNLTEADTVIHYDPWWNPAVERQATDRAHRIGQRNTVFVYKLVAENTVEEKIIALQQRKAALADAIYRKDGGSGEMLFNEEDIAALLGPGEG